MADGTGLFSNLLGNASTYFDISRVFPGVEQFLDIEKSLKNINAQLGRTSKSTFDIGRTTNKVMDNAKKSLAEYKDGFIELANSQKAPYENNKELNNQIVETNKSLGSSSNAWKEYGSGIKIATNSNEDFFESSKNIRDIIYENSIVYGLSIDKMTEMSLASTKFNQSLGQEGVKSLTAFSDATGMYVTTLSDFYSKMQATGAITEKSFEKMSVSILGAREKYGLATESLYDLFEVTEKYAMVVGATEDRLINATSRMAEFISAMNSAGVESRTSADLLDKIIDPDRMQENYLLLSKMGLTMEELNFGDPMENIQKSLPELKKIAQNIVAEPSRMAANEMAKLYGYSLEEMRKFSQIEFSEVDLARQKSTMEYRKEIQTAMDGLDNIKNSLFGGIAMLFNKVVTPITNILGPTGTFGAPMFGVAMFGIMKKVKTIFEKIAESFADTIGKGLRYALTTSVNQKTLSGGTSGIREGLVESESRLQDVRKQAENYKKTAGVNNKNLAQIRQEISESVLGRDLTRVEKEIASRQEFKATKDKRKTYSVWKEKVTGIIEDSRSQLSDLEKREKEIKSLMDSKSIPEEAGRKMLSNIQLQQDATKSNIDKAFSSNAGKLLQNELLGKEINNLDRINEELAVSTEEKIKLEKALEKAERKGDYQNVKAVRELLGIENEKINNLNEQVEKSKTMTNALNITKSELNSVNAQKEILAKQEEIARLEAEIASDNVSEETKKINRRKIESVKSEINNLKKDVKDFETQKRAMKLTDANLDKQAIQDSKYFSDFRREERKIARKKKKQSKNELLGLDLNANIFQRGGKKLTTSLTSGFTGMTRGFATGGIRGAASGALSGLGTAMPAILGISVAVGGMLSLAKKSDKFNNELKRITSVGSRVVESIGKQVGDFIAPGLENIANFVEKIANKFVKDDETEDLSNSLQEYSKAEMTKTIDSQGNLILQMQIMNEQMGEMVSAVNKDVEANQTSAMAALKNN